MMKSNNFFQPPPPPSLPPQSPPSLPPQQPPQPQVRPGKGPKAPQGQDPQGLPQHSERFKGDLNSVNVKESSIKVLSETLNYVRMTTIEACNALDLVVINTGKKKTGSNPNNGNEGGPDVSAGKGSGGSMEKWKGTPSKSAFADDTDGDDYDDEDESDDDDDPFSDDNGDIAILNEDDDEAFFGAKIGKKKDKPHDTDSKGKDANKDGKSGADENRAKRKKEKLLQSILRRVNTKSKEIGRFTSSDSLNIEDFATIFSYTFEPQRKTISSIYKTINEALAQRAADRTLEGGGYILNLITAIRKLPRYTGKELYRGVCGHVNEMNLETGNVLSWPAFTSTTSEKKVAMRFMENRKIDTLQGEGRYLFVIKGNFHGYDISQFSDFEREKEVLLEPETTYKVDTIGKDKTENGTPYIQIEVTVINKENPKKGDAPEEILKEIKEDQKKIDTIIERFQFLKEEKMNDPKWILKRIMIYNSYPEFCLFYLNNLKEAFTSSTLSRTSKTENIIKAGEFRGVKVLSEILRSHKMNLNIRITGLYAIYVITSNYDLNKEYASNAIDSAIRSLNEYEDNEYIQMYGFGILWNINKTHAQLVAEKEGVIDTILNKFNSRRSVEVFTYGCDILRNEKIKYSIEDKKRVIKVISKLMIEFDKFKVLNHTDSRDIYTEGLRVLEMLISENEEIILPETIVTDIINTINERCFNADICHLGYKIFRDFSTSSAHNRKLIAQLGGINAILNGMKIYVDNSDACEQGFHTLLSIATDNSSKKKAIKGGAIDVALGFMKKHNDNIKACELGCKTLFCLTEVEDTETSKCKGKIIDAVIETMEINTASEKICEYGCGTLRNLIVHKYDNQVSRRNKVIIDIIFQVLKRHNTNSHICRYGCDALIEITNNSYYFQLGPGKTKMVDAVIEAIKGNTRDIEMWRSGCGLLKNIATNWATRAKAIDTIILGMNENIENTDICIIGCDALGVITSKDVLTNEFKSSFLKIVSSTLNIHQYNSEVGLIGCETLKKILMSDYDYRSKETEEETFGAVMTVLGHQIGNYDLCRIGCDVLVRITTNSRPKIIDISTIQVILGILGTHSGNAFIRQRVFKILKRMKKKVANARTISGLMLRDPVLRKYYFKLFGIDIVMLFVVFYFIALIIKILFF